MGVRKLRNFAKLSFFFEVTLQRKEISMEYPTFYRTVQIDGLSIFYREAGPKDAPTILLSVNGKENLRVSGRVLDVCFQYKKGGA